MNPLDIHNPHSRIRRKCLNWTLSFWERVSGAALTYTARPRLANDTAAWSAPRPDLPPFALILQGPIVKERDFTLESMKLYRRTFPNAMLILSTWKSEPQRCLDSFKRLGVEVVAGDYPPSPGRQNINYQLASSFSGLTRAAAMGAQYALKSRTDQRIHATDVQPMLMNLLKAFPLKAAGVQRERIVGASLATLRYRMYGLTDMFVFGHIEDMLLYWGAPFSDAPVPHIEGSATLRRLARDRACETYLMTEFLARLGRKIEWTLADSWRAFADHCCIIDAESLNLYWPKYTRFQERRFGSNFARRVDELLTFMDWLQLYTGSTFQHDVPEWILDEQSQELSPRM